MLRKIKKFLIILSISFLSFVLSSCSTGDKFTFQEGIYEYSGEDFYFNNFYSEILICNISLEFSSESNDYNKTNVIVNRVNNRSYYVDFYIENSNNEGFHCSFETFNKRIGNKFDVYHIHLDISDLIQCENSYFEIDLTFKNSNYNAKNKDSYEANMIYLIFNRFYINESKISEYDIPYRIVFKYVEEE